MGPEELGYYSLAWTLIIQPVNRINPILTRVAFPFFAQMQSETERLKRGYLLLLRILSTINSPILLGVSAIAPLLVPLIYGQKWQPAAILVQLLAGVGLFRSMINPSGVLILAKGRADLGFIWGAGVVVVQVIGVWISVYNYGTIGAAVGLLLLYAFYLIALYWFLLRTLVGPFFGCYVSAIMQSVFTAGAMAILVWALPHILPLPIPAVLAIQILVGAAVYIALSVAMQPRWTTEILAMLRLKPSGH
jgi:lipopolysaccharide exporter